MQAAAPERAETGRNAPQYCVRGPYRFVDAYVHVHTTWVKRKWVGETLMAVVRAWFKAYPEECYLDAIARGELRVDGKIVPPEYVLRDTQVIEHALPRVEQPVYALRPRVVHEDDKYFVVDKPPDLICHESSQQYYNSLQQILAHDLKVPGPLHLVHRLDGVTSGVVIFSKSAKITGGNNGTDAQSTETDANAHEQYFKEKVYVARVQGDFPAMLHEVDKALYMPHSAVKVYDGDSAEEAARLNAKAARTLFDKVWYDARTNTSLVRCRPLTGRTHQIRVHLSWAGHPIVNDVKYGARFVGNLSVKHHFPEYWQHRDAAAFCLADENDAVREGVAGEQSLFAKLAAEERKRKWDLVSQPREICLHALQYTLNDQTFRTDEPFWANKDFAFE